MKNHPCSTRLPIAILSACLGVILVGCGDDDPMEPLAVCEDPVDLFPTPVSSATSPFPSIDDEFLQVSFRTAFSFSFYGANYSSVFLNTNGGMTFGSGNDSFDEAATDVDLPGIAVFWGDLDAEEYGGVDRAGQMSYLSCDDRFVVTYNQLQDNDDETWNNSATVTLGSDGRIQIVYGSVLSEDILVGVFDGTHADDRYLAVASEFAGYNSTGTGIILFDDWGLGPTHNGELSGRTVVYSPSGSPAVVSPAVVPAEHEPGVRAKGPKR